MRTVRQISHLKPLTIKTLKVAAYARISHSDLRDSLATQISYYSELIQSTENWQYAGVYVDDSISGRTQIQRHGFQDLLVACRTGQVDVILTKSISRFGRNTVELLSVVRELKALGISVRFEKEGIDTLTADGELLMTLLASVAQAESDSLSQNLKWQIRKKFEQGIPHTPQDIFGYRWNGEEYVIEPDEASVVRQVFDWYLEGTSVPEITKRLNEQGVLTRLGNPFTVSSVREFFKQEAYFGRLVLQKTYREEFGRNPKRNEGQRTKYIVEDAHEPIVTKDYFDRVIAEKTRRYHIMFQESHKHKGVFRDKIICHHCQTSMIVRVDSKRVNRTIRYCCRNRDRFGKEACVARTLSEKRLLASLRDYHDSPISKDWADENVASLSFDSLLNHLIVTPKKGKSYQVPVKKGRHL